MTDIRQISLKQIIMGLAYGTLIICGCTNIPHSTYCYRKATLFSLQVIWIVGHVMKWNTLQQNVYYGEINIYTNISAANVSDFATAVHQFRRVPFGYLMYWPVVLQAILTYHFIGLYLCCQCALCQQKSGRMVMRSSVVKTHTVHFVR